MKRIAAIALLLGCGSKDAKIPDDHRIHRTDTADRTRIVGKAVDVSTIPFDDDTIGLPVSGTADIDIDVKAPQHHYGLANGHIIIHCTHCQIGDDKKNLPKPDQDNPLTGPIYFGHVELGQIDVDVAIADGRATVKQFTITSPDLELTVTGGAQLATPLEDSEVDLCVRFKPTDALAKRDPKTSAVLMLTGAPTAPDGFFNIHLTDHVGRMRRLGQICDGSTPPDAPTRPQLTGSGS